MSRSREIIGKVPATAPAVLLGTMARHMAARYRSPEAVVISEHEVRFRARAIPGIFDIRATVRLHEAKDGTIIAVSGEPVPRGGAHVLLALQLLAACDLLFVTGSGLRSLLPLLASVTCTAVLYGGTALSLSRLARKVIEHHQ